MYIADWSFERRLKNYDPKLSVRWVPRRERWGIFRSTPDKNNLYDRTFLVFIVEEPSGEFRPLDERVFDRLRKADNHMRGHKEIMREIEEENDRIEEQRNKAFRQEMEDITRDIAPIVRREMSEDFGSVNVPAEDLDAQLSTRVGGSEKLEEILS